MRKTSTLNLLCTGLFLSFAITAGAQTASPNKPSYKESILDNPNAEADIAVVESFVRSLVKGDLDKAKGLIASDYKGVGPSPDDSFTAESLLAAWKEKYNAEKDRKVSFVTQTFRVASGDLQGDWVSMWGDYTFTSNGKTVKVPYQYTALVKSGKIATDIIYYDRLYIMQQLGHTLTPPAQK
jgi:ketosteroid isomerase-like protein